MDNNYAKDTRSQALDHVEAVKAVKAAAADAVEVGLRLAEVYALLSIRDALVDVGRAGE